MIALADCNSFYASCEKIFRPDLKKKPVVVLSNNDGCIVAMSPEAKAMGVKRGKPLFRYRKELDKMGCAYFSSNYTLYQDISNRVMELFKEEADLVEVYSIDEAFLHMDAPSKTLESWGANLRDRVYRCVGVPISVGIGRSKTLAKIAASVAKKKNGMFLLTSAMEEAVLKNTPVHKIWGVGPSKAEYLMSRGVLNAWELRNMEDYDVKKSMSLVTLRTLWELRGKPSIAQEDAVLERKGILSSLGFSTAIKDKNQLRQAVASYTARAARKLWAQNSTAGRLSLFIMTNRYKDNYYFKEECRRLEQPTNYLPTLIEAAEKCLDKIFIAGLPYAKAGVLLMDIQKQQENQLDLFHSQDQGPQKIIQVVKELEQRYGTDSLTPLTARMDTEWSMKRRYLSPCYTTQWPHLPEVL